MNPLTLWRRLRRALAADPKPAPAPQPDPELPIGAILARADEARATVRIIKMLAPTVATESAEAELALTLAERAAEIGRSPGELTLADLIAAAGRSRATATIP